MILIKNAKILTMAGKNIESGYIIIRDGKIRQLGTDADMPSETGFEKVIDAHGGYVLPGFVDAHCHIGMWEDGVGQEGADGNEATDPVTPQLKAIDGIFFKDNCFNEAREAGVTVCVTGPGSANVIGGQFAAVKTLPGTPDDMILSDCIAMKMAFGENPKRVYGGQNKCPSTRMGTAAIIRESLLMADEYQRKIEQAKESNESKKPDFNYKYESLAKVLGGRLLVKAHAHRQDDIITAIRVAREFNLHMTIEHGTEGYLISEYIKNANFGVIAGPIISDRSKIELRNQSPKNPGILAKAGILTAIMTDHPVIPIQYLPLCATVVGDYIVDFVKIDFFFQVFNEFFGKRRPNRIDQNGLFVTN
jgi:imidazolonepropionase-like amidohydrolase